MTRTATERRTARQQRAWANRTRHYTKRLHAATDAHDKLAAACDFLRAATLERPCEQIAALAEEITHKAYEWNDRNDDDH